MAGTLTISTLSDGTNSSSVTDVVKGSARAWASFNGQTVSLRKSYNVSSIVDNGVGDYTINFITPIVDDQYIAVYGANGGTVGYAGSWAQSATSLRIWGSFGSSFNDIIYGNVAVFR